MKPEKKLWHEIKEINIKNNCKLSFTRLENSAAWGTPDILGYNNSGHFFTIELKATRGNKVRLSPHQISFHIRHPNNTFIMVKDLSLNLVKLYEGSRIRELVTHGIRTPACCLGLPETCLLLENLN